MQKITTMLWFNTEAEEAANFYTSVFKNSKIGRVMHNDVGATDSTGVPQTSALVVEFELEGHEFAALNGGPMFTFNESVSMVVNCTTQEEVDYYWNALTSDGGQESQCGWLKDKYGLSWQITPVQLTERINDKDRAKAGRAFQAMLQMRKIDIKAIEDAANGN